MSENKGAQLGRREFMHSAAAAGAAVTTFGILNPANADTKATGETLKVGLIGCGGRGTGAALQAIQADPNTKLVALADTFKDMMVEARTKLQKSPAGDRVQVEIRERLLPARMVKPPFVRNGKIIVNSQKENP